jgi:hypothetical protein
MAGMRPDPVISVKRAKYKLEIVAFREKGKFDGGWFWALPQHAPDESTEE